MQFARRCFYQSRFKKILLVSFVINCHQLIIISTIPSYDTKIIVGIGLLPEFSTYNSAELSIYSNQL